jgi:HPt (histidine-containing phosphotransfer) domain-containing protein
MRAGTSTFDLDELSRRAGDDAGLVLDIVRVFLEDCPARLDALDRGVRGGDADAIRSAAHALKGAASYLSARAVVGAALTLERLGGDRQIDGAASVLQELHRHVAALTADLRRFLHEHESGGA